MGRTQQITISFGSLDGNFSGTEVDSIFFMASIKSIIISKQFENAFKLLHDKTILDENDKSLSCTLKRNYKIRGVASPFIHMQFMTIQRIPTLLIFLDRLRSRLERDCYQI